MYKCEQDNIVTSPDITHRPDLSPGNSSGYCSSCEDTELNSASERKRLRNNRPTLMKTWLKDGLSVSAGAEGSEQNLITTDASISSHSVNSFNSNRAFISNRQASSGDVFSLQEERCYMRNDIDGDDDSVINVVDSPVVGMSETHLRELTSEDVAESMMLDDWFCSPSSDDMDSEDCLLLSVKRCDSMDASNHGMLIDSFSEIGQPYTDMHAMAESSEENSVLHNLLMEVNSYTQSSSNMRNSFDKTQEVTAAEAHMFVNTDRFCKNNLNFSDTGMDVSPVCFQTRPVSLQNCSNIRLRKSSEPQTGRSLNESHQTLAQLNSTDDVITLQDSLLSDVIFSQGGDVTGQDSSLLSDDAADRDSFLDDIINDHLLLDTLRCHHQGLLADFDIDDVVFQGRDSPVHSVNRKLSLQEIKSPVSNFRKASFNCTTNNATHSDSKLQLISPSCSKVACNRRKRRESSSSGDNGSLHLKRATSYPEVSPSQQGSSDLTAIYKTCRYNSDINRLYTNKNSNNDVDEKLLFLEDHRYSSRKRSEGRVSSDSGFSSESSASSRHSSVIRNKLPVSALETILRSRQSFNPNRGSDALLTSSVTNVQTVLTKTNVKSGADVKFSTVEHRALDEQNCSNGCFVPTHNPTLETVSTTSTENKSISSLRLLHRLLTGPTNENLSQTSLPVVCSAEKRDCSSESKSISADSCHLYPVQDSDDEQWSKIDYSLILENSAYEDEDDELDLLTSITTGNTTLHLGKNEGIETKNSDSCHKEDTTSVDRGVDHTNDLQDVTQRTPHTLTSSSINRTTPASSSINRKLNNYDDHETWFLQYFDNLF